MSVYGDYSMVLREEPKELDSATAAEAGEGHVEQQEGDTLDRDEEGFTPDEDLLRWAQQVHF